MAGKRNATRDLNHTNWDKEDEPEDAGTFTKASSAVIQRRVIKTARRRNPISSQSSNADAESKSVFGTFSGFAKPTPTSTAFGFLNNLSKSQEDEPKSNGINSDKNQPMFKSLEHKGKSVEKDSEYYAKLKGLNESVANWIKKHVDSNPFLNLKPIFEDYEKYFEELEKLKTEDKSKAVSNEGNKMFSPSVREELSNFVFKPTEKTSESSDSSKVSAPQFSFVSKDVQSGATQIPPTFAFTSPNTKTEVSKEAPQFTFGTTTTTTSFSFGAATPKSSTKGFSFGGPTSTPFTFANVSNKQASEKKDVEEDKEDGVEPPKVEFTPVVEDGHIYTVRCKVFVKKGDSFVDGGVGNLYLKPVPNSEKVQLIVRADTNLGNLLCNFILSDSIPLKRMGKKDVMLVCLPTPESNPPPVPILLRVKSTDEAENLFKVLEKYKK